MTSGKVLSEIPISLVEVREYLDKIKKRDEKLDFRAQRTEEYIQGLDLPDSKTAMNLLKKIEDLNVPRLKDIHIQKLIEMMPTNTDEVKSILSAYSVNINNDNIKRIINVIGNVE